MDFVLTNRKYSFENPSLYEIGVSDHHHHHHHHHHPIYRILKKCVIKISKAEPQLVHYRNSKNFQFFFFMNDLNND